MQNNQNFIPPVPPLHPARQADDYAHNASIASIFSGKILPPGSVPLQPHRGFMFQPFEACPRNFVIIDRTNNISQIMFHPSIGRTLCCAGEKPEAADGDTYLKYFVGNDVKEKASWKEDSAGIDALLSIDREEDEYDEEEMSTARTHTDCGSSSPDSCSNYDSPPRKSRKTTTGEGSAGERKRRKVRKMVNTLRGIVPGANHTNTVAVLDEAIKYLKSLKVEVQKLGLGK